MSSGTADTATAASHSFNVTATTTHTAAPEATVAQQRDSATTTRAAVTNVPTEHKAATESPVRSASASATPVPSTQPVQVYFTRGTTLVAEPRQLSLNDAPRLSVLALLGGPKNTGDLSQLPSGTKLLGFSVTNNLATVDLSSEFATVQGMPAIPLSLGQLVYTLTQFPDVKQVSLLVNGHPLRSFGGEGETLKQPLDRAYVQALLTQAGV